MDRNDRNILVLGLLILIVLGVAYYFLLFSPLRQDYLARFNERTQKEAQKAQLAQSIAQLEQVRREAPNIERQILELSKRIPEQAEIPTLVVQIEQVAREAQVTQLRIEPGQPETPPGGGDFSRIPITMSFEGTYEEMQDFLLFVRNLARLVTVNEVSYSEAEPAGGEGTVNRDVEDLLTVEIQAEAYVQPAAGGTTAGGGIAPAGGETSPPEGGAPKGGEAPTGGAPKGGGAPK
ncbi:hypothetical protein BH24ACT19_BH24ACT19_06710 [soil metagenome]